MTYWLVMTFGMFTPMCPMHDSEGHTLLGLHYVRVVWQNTLFSFWLL